jgi:hypothetical protein
LGGYHDWRLPLIGELAGLYDPKQDGHLKGGIRLSSAWAWSANRVIGEHEFRDGYLHGASLGIYRVPPEPAIYFFFGGGKQDSLPIGTASNFRALCVRVPVE